MPEDVVDMAARLIICHITSPGPSEVRPTKSHELLIFARLPQHPSTPPCNAASWEVSGPQEVAASMIEVVQWGQRRDSQCLKLADRLCVLMLSYERNYGKPSGHCAAT
jgi:hypothetical protein